MANFPQWPKLKHFSVVTNIKYSDRQAFFDILKCCLPCLVDVLSKNEPMLFCIRAYQKYRMMIGLSCHSSSRLDLLERKLIPDYERRCKTFEEKAPQSILLQDPVKGSNKKRPKLTSKQTGEVLRNSAQTGTRKRPGTNNSWTLKAPQRVTDSNLLETTHKTDPAYKDFDLRLRGFVAQNFPHLCAVYQEVIKIYPFNSFEVRYASLDDWSLARDLLRCNTNWNKKGPQADSVLIHAEGEGLSHVRLVKVFRCKFVGSGRTLDLALVRMFTLERKWKPRTVWDGCQVFMEDKQSTFVSMEYIIRGALLAPTKKAGTYTLVDRADYDMFLRANKYE
ncbi:hypothetical protein C8J56DRAFT_891122 [Mycena floridula]|nr:hypothetical protein C8J56DRAFT_891122 [Mycena floridula]